MNTSEHMEYCLEFQAKRIYKQTKASITILTSTIKGEWINLPKSQIDIEDFDGDNPNIPMVRVVLPEWLYDKNPELTQITMVHIERWTPDNKIETVI